MRAFARRSTVEQAQSWLDANPLPRRVETVALRHAAGRVLAAAVSSPVNVPAFDRAMMDGFAVMAADTLGASNYQPQPLQVVGDSFPGRPFAGVMVRGQAVRIMTGAPLPAAADAVLPVEQTQSAREFRYVEALESVPPGKHVGRLGEDVTAGTEVLRGGRRLRPQDVGLLASLGQTRPEVWAAPRVAIVATGNELVPASEMPRGCQIIDSNGPMLTALVTRDGGQIISASIVADDPDSLAEALHVDADLLLISGGSSVGDEDHAPELLRRHGELAIHGIAMRPSSPAGLGRFQKRMVALLPGNPVSCLCAYDFFAGRSIRVAAGLGTAWPYPISRLPLRDKLVSAIGRVDYARVECREGHVVPLAIGGASRLSSTTRADGFVIVPAESEGLPVGAEVDVWLY